MHLKPGLEEKGRGEKEGQRKTGLCPALKTQADMQWTGERIHQLKTVTQRSCQGASTRLRRPEAHMEAAAGPLPGPDAESLPGHTLSRATQTGTQQPRPHTHWRGLLCGPDTVDFRKLQGEVTKPPTRAASGRREHEPAETGCESGSSSQLPTGTCPPSLAGQGTNCPWAHPTHLSPAHPSGRAGQGKGTFMEAVGTRLQSKHFTCQTQDSK